MTDLKGFDFDAFVDGYIECALWADCLPAEPCCHICGETIYRNTIDGVQTAWAHSLERGAHLAAGPAFYPGETGGGEDLALRDGARETMVERGRLADFVNCHLDDLLAYCAEMGTWHGRTDSLGNDSYVAERVAGHDFWYCRVGHGTGFWDHGLGELGERLSQASQTYGSADDHTPYDCGDGTADV